MYERICLRLHVSTGLSGLAVGQSSNVIGSGVASLGSVLALMGAKRKAVTLMRSWVNAF